MNSRLGWFPSSTRRACRTQFVAYLCVSVPRTRCKALKHGVVKLHDYRRIDAVKQPKTSVQLHVKRGMRLIPSPVVAAAILFTHLCQNAARSRRTSQYAVE